MTGLERRRRFAVRDVDRASPPDRDTPAVESPSDLPPARPTVSTWMPRVRPWTWATAAFVLVLAVGSAIVWGTSVRPLATLRTTGEPMTLDQGQRPYESTPYGAFRSLLVSVDQFSRLRCVSVNSDEGGFWQGCAPAGADATTGLFVDVPLRGGVVSVDDYHIGPDERINGMYRFALVGDVVEVYAADARD